MIGQGIYTIAEASRLTTVHPATVRTWFKGYADKPALNSLLRSDYEPVGKDFAISFYDLIDIRVACDMRSAGVKMSIVRKAHEKLANELDTSHPFCHDGLLTDGRTIIRDFVDEVGDRRLQEVISKQQLFKQIRGHLQRVDYSHVTHLAERWHIAKGVVIDPAITFGKPTVEGTRISTHILAQQYKANHQEGELVADLYGISEKDVNNAVAFEMSLCGIAA